MKEGSGVYSYEEGLLSLVSDVLINNHVLLQASHAALPFEGADVVGLEVDYAVLVAGFADVVEVLGGSEELVGFRLADCSVA